MHDNFMLAALEQAAQFRGFCAPNPAVGAVAVINDQIVAKAAHHGVGTAHAEALLLQQLPDDCSDVTLYVTLEPCNHWGRTPPCIDAIIQKKVARVVYAYTDPNPVVSENNTPALLQAQGVEVIHHPLAKVDRFYQSYHYWLKHGLPWVTVKIAQSLDGKIAARDNQPVAITNSQCQDFTHQQRRYSDVLLSTADTVLADNPALNVRLRGETLAKPVAILDRNLKLTSGLQIFQTARHCFIFYDKGIPVVAPKANCTYHPTPVHNDQLDLPFILQTLGAMGYHDVWVEAGGKLFHALHQQQLVQRTYVYIAPKILGAEAVPAYPFLPHGLEDPRVSWKIMGNNLIGRLDWMEKKCLPES